MKVKLQNVDPASNFSFDNLTYAKSVQDLNSHFQIYDFYNDKKENSPTTLISLRQLYLSRAKLKTTNKTSGLMAGFAMVALVELQIDEETDMPSGLVFSFVVCTSLLVAVHMLSLMIGTYILPNIEEITGLHNNDLVNESPHEKMHWYIETAWAFSTVLGVMLFLTQLTILFWVKFYDFSYTAAYTGTVIMVPVIVVFIFFAIHFYRKLDRHKSQLAEIGLDELQGLKNQLDICEQKLPTSASLQSV